MAPGERTRASLALLMANGANLLVLDEPTNHLDLPAIEQLEQALDTFAGTVILGERYPPATWAGALVVVAGVALVTWSQARRR